MLSLDARVTLVKLTSSSDFVVRIFFTDFTIKAKFGKAPATLRITYLINRRKKSGLNLIF